MRVYRFLAASCFGFGLYVAMPAQALQIVLTDMTVGGPAPAAVIEGFEEAASIWEGLLSDPVTVRIDVAFATLDDGVLGGALSNSQFFAYTDARSAMIADITSLDDVSAVGSLAADADFQFIVRDLDETAMPLLAAISDDGFGATEWNTTLDINRANAKALGLLADDGLSDANITFSDQFNFDFNPADGIDAGAFDFVGVATHEIGHALGFVSGVDLLDFVSGPDGPASGCCNTLGDDPDTDAQASTIFTPLDLFRYSDFSSTFDGEGPLDIFRDFTFGEAGDVFFSLDGGGTNLGTFSTGRFNGLGTAGGQQASHWEDSLGLGIMDPTAAFGEALMISGLDLRAFDAIGWDLPAPIGLPLVGVVSLLLWRRLVGGDG